MSNLMSVQWREGGPLLRPHFRNVFAFLLVVQLLAVGPLFAAEPPRLDLNRASAEELEALPGIGAVKAAAILAVRDERGGFQSLEELETVRGIGPRLVEQLRPLIVVQAARSTGLNRRSTPARGAVQR